MNTRTGWLLGLIIVILIIIGAVMYMHRSSSGYPAVDTGTSAAPTNTTATTPAATATSSAAVPGDNLTLGQSTDASLGSYLVAYNGMTLYTYAPDTTGVSNCTGGCAAAWPPYTVTSAANLMAESPISGALGTLTRADGSTQVTYNGHPLYFYIKDKNPGDTTGQGVGGVWFVVKP